MVVGGVAAEPVVAQDGSQCRVVSTAASDPRQSEDGADRVTERVISRFLVQ